MDEVSDGRSRVCNTLAFMHRRFNSYLIHGSGRTIAGVRNLESSVGKGSVVPTVEPKTEHLSL